MADKEIGDLTAASTPLAGSELLHGVQSGNSRKLTVDDVRDITNQTAKATPVDADEFLLWDSVATAFKKLTIANLKAWVLAFVDNRPADFSLVRLHTANGYGSTNTQIRRFSTVVDYLNPGDDITYVDSATAGASFTIEKDGIYAVSFSDNFNAAGYLGLSLNSTQLTSTIGNITAADRLALGTCTANNLSGFVAWTGPLSGGDVIRAHTEGQASGGAPARSNFTIARIA